MERTREYETLLVVHGSYLEGEVEMMERRQKRSFEISEEVVKQIVEYVQ